ncbi:tripartite motif-containing protein 10-like [Tiliqua scincoides]|uniref:tripartite motif-containing protein 10-like n=1 Tax=Tiliqua scincoides TaxID=71010 RepID=UPI0034623D68
MAAASPSMDVKEELKCSICLDFLTQPVSVDCGHNFCRGCISQYCETWEDLGEDPGDLVCPLCKARIKKGNFRPNWQLANVAEKIKHLSLNLRKEDLCERHQEKLNLFCKEDQELVCVGCERSPEHQSHTFLLLEEAAKECKGQFCSYLEILRREKMRIQLNKLGTEKESEDLLGQIKEKKTRTVAAFNQLHQFLEEQKMFLLSQMELLEKEIEARRKEHMTRLMEDMSVVEFLIQQMEEKCQQSTSELLQDIRTTQRYMVMEEFDPVAFSPELACRIRRLYDVKPLLEGVMKQFSAHLQTIRGTPVCHGTVVENGCSSDSGSSAANVTLDPDTAHPELILSEDRKSVRAKDKRQYLPDNPERFDFWPFVLGCEGFTGHRHFWDVTVGSEEPWAVGVTRKSVRRKGMFDVSPEEGIWAVMKWRGAYIIHNPPFNTIPSSQELKRIRVMLNYDEGQVAFSDADTGVHLYTYSGASFCGETLLPFFHVSLQARLTLSP